MKLSTRRIDGRGCRGFSLVALCCVSALIGMSGISVGDTIDISELPTLPPAFGAKLAAPETMDAAKIGAFLPLPTMKRLPQRQDEVQAEATADMKPGQARAGALLDINPVPAVDPIVKPPLPESKGLQKPVLPPLKPSACKCKGGSGKKCRRHSQRNRNK